MMAEPMGSVGANTWRAASHPGAYKPRLVVWMAVIGAAFVALEIDIFWRWVASPDFAPSPRGDDPIPPITLMLVQVFQGIAVVLVAVVLYAVWRTSRREGRLSLFGIIALAWWTLWWQDMVWMWARPAQFYNGYFFNRGNWSHQIPGWINPTSQLDPEPILFIGGAYLWFLSFGTMLTSWSMCAARRRWPGLNPWQLCLIGFSAMVLFDFVQEASWVRSQLYAYPVTIHAWSLWGGTRYQFPVYEAIFWGAVNAAPGFLYFFRNDRGQTLLDRGLERVRFQRCHSLLRWLAMVAFMNILYLLYNCVMIPITFHADATPVGYPSWLRNGMCGAGTQYDCPAPTVPIPLPGSGPNHAHRDNTVTKKSER